MRFLAGFVLVCAVAAVAAPVHIYVANSNVDLIAVIPTTKREPKNRVVEIADRASDRNDFTWLVQLSGEGGFKGKYSQPLAPANAKPLNSYR